jgi:hypothetical protein
LGPLNRITQAWCDLGDEWIKQLIPQKNK